jgi:hypothetical protein
MPIKEISAPDKSVDIFKDWVSKHKLGRPRKRPYKYEEAVPHKVFHANLNDIIAGKGFENAQLVAWRHLHTDGKGHHAVVEVRIGEKEDEHFLQETHHGPLVIEQKEILPQLKLIEELEKEHFEFCLLRMFALKIHTIWLRASEREDDYFIPFSPCFYGLVAGKLYTSKDFLKIVKTAAQMFYQQMNDQNEDDMKGG